MLSGTAPAVMGVLLGQLGYNNYRKAIQPEARGAGDTMELPSFARGIVDTRQYDVVVTGAGVAGVAAALEAARCGVRVALVEKTIQPGGLATTGLVYVFLPLCDGQGRQVTYGIAEELLHLSYRYGPGDIPDGWKTPGGQRDQRLMAVFSPAAFVLALDEALEAAGVELWYDSLACLPQVSGGRVSGVELETKAGRVLLQANCVVDASGDADIAARAGAPAVQGDNWLSLWALQGSLEQARRAVEGGDPEALLSLIALGGDASGSGQPPEMPKLNGLSAQAVTRFAVEARRLLREYYRQRQPAVGRAALFPLTLPGMAQFRTTRRIIGVEGLADGQHGQRFASSVGLAADWRKPGYVWEIPYGALLPRGVDGLLAAGRCIASAGDAWEVTRVIPAAALTGQAAGLAAAMAVKENTMPGALAVDRLQAELRRRGIPIHEDEIG